MEETEDNEFAEVTQNRPGRPKRQRTRDEYAHDLLKHSAKFPGFYRPDEPYNSDHNERFRVWTREKIRLQECFDVAEAVGSGPRLTCTPTIRVPVVTAKRQDRLDAETYRLKYLEKIKIMESLESGSGPWRAVRTEAYNLKNRYLNRCEIDRINPHTDLPEIPKDTKRSKP